VSDEGHILNVLDACYTNQFAIFFIVSPECDTLVYLAPELVFRHIRFLPTVHRDDPFIGLGGVIDNLVDDPKLVVVTLTDHDPFLT
jgi:hypothetical protein